MNYVKDLSLTNKTVFLRCDLNVPMKDGLIIDRTRIIASIPTIKYLISVGAKIVICSHLGRPAGSVNPKYSLAPICHELEKTLDVKIQFLPDILSDESIKTVHDAPFGSIFMLENIRFYPEEESGDDAFAFKLAQYANIFVNDAFACSHRKHASIYGITKYLPSLAGINLLQEVQIIESIIAGKEKIFAIIGGSKVSTKIELLKSLVQKSSYLVLGGGMANTFLVARGIKVGASLVELEEIETAKYIEKRALECGCNIVLPIDVVVSHSILKPVNSRVCLTSDIKSNEMIVDIGPESLINIHNLIKSFVGLLIWNGPLGVYENQPFDCGSIALARSIALLTDPDNRKSIVGGGDAVACVEKAGMVDRMSFVSTAGGAFLEYIEKEKLESIEKLKENIQI